MVYIFTTGFLRIERQTLKEEEENENIVDRNDGHHICFRNGNVSLDVYFIEDGFLLCKECKLTIKWGYFKMILASTVMALFR